MKDEIKDIRTELREKEALLAALEKEQGVTRFSKFKTGVVAGAGAAAGAVQTLGGKIRVLYSTHVFCFALVCIGSMTMCLVLIH